MPFKEFAIDLRDAMPVVAEFQGGQKSQRVHLNKLVAACEAVRNAANARAGEEEAGAGDEAILLLNEGGVLTSWTVNMRRT